MYLTPEQLHEIRQVIADHHNAFIANVISPAAVSAETLEKLKAKGLVDVKMESIRDAYLYGQVLATLDDPKLQKMTFEEFKAYIAKNPIPLTAVERQAIDMAQAQAAQYAVGLGNRVDQQTGQLLIEADHNLRQELRNEIKDKVSANIAKRETTKQLKSDLGWATKDWARDWDRIARTEKTSAMQHGIADHFFKEHGPDVLVAKIPRANACTHCKRLHLGSDGQPRIFRLSQLVQAGSNFKVKADAWQATVGPVHPNCQCQLVRIPAGHGFDKEGRIVPGGKYGERYDNDEDLEASIKEVMTLQKSFRAGGEFEWKGLKIFIESPAGAVRKWTDQQGRKGETVMLYPYGYFVGTNGADNEEIDVYVGPNLTCTDVYVVHQQNPKNGLYDETKCFIGFESAEEVEAVYRKHYDSPDFFGWIDCYDVEAFKRQITNHLDDINALVRMGLMGEVVLGDPAKVKAAREDLSKAYVKPKFVLSKSADDVAPGEVSQAARGPVGGFGVSRMMNEVPRRKPHSLDDTSFDVKGLFTAMYLDRAPHENLKRDKETYDMGERVAPVRPIDIPPEWREQFLKLRSLAPKNREMVENEYQRQHLNKPRNTAEVEGPSRDPETEVPKDAEEA